MFTPVVWRNSVFLFMDRYIRIVLFPHFWTTPKLVKFETKTTDWVIDTLHMFFALIVCYIIIHCLYCLVNQFKYKFYTFCVYSKNREIKTKSKTHEKIGKWHLLCHLMVSKWKQTSFISYPENSSDTETTSADVYTSSPFTGKWTHLHLFLCINNTYFSTPKLVQVRLWLL